MKIRFDHPQNWPCPLQIRQNEHIRQKNQERNEGQKDIHEEDVKSVEGWKVPVKHVRRSALRPMRNEGVRIVKIVDPDESDLEEEIRQTFHDQLNPPESIHTSPHGPSEPHHHSKSLFRQTSRCSPNPKNLMQNKSNNQASIKKKSEVQETAKFNETHMGGTRMTDTTTPARPRETRTREHQGVADARSGQGSCQGLSLFEKACVDLCEFGQTDWVPLPKPLVVDSGAGETVIPNEWMSGHATLPSAGSKAQDYYTTADGTKVYNEGEKKLDVCTLDGKHKRSMTFQVARVKKALGPVSQMVQNNNRVVFDQEDRGRDVSYARAGEYMVAQGERRIRVGPLGGSPAGR